jgi:hypothetical protein
VLCLLPHSASGRIKGRRCPHAPTDAPPLALPRWTLKEQLAAAEARDAQHVAQLAAEQAKVERAFAELSAVAERLAALAEERAKPWWRRLRLRAV